MEKCYLDGRGRNSIYSKRSDCTYSVVRLFGYGHCRCLSRHLIENMGIVRIRTLDIIRGQRRRLNEIDRIHHAIVCATQLYSNIRRVCVHAYLDCLR